MVKVEVYGTASPEGGSVDAVERSPRVVHWSEEDGLEVNPPDGSVLAPPGTKDKNDKSAFDGQEWLSARGDRGADEGVHDWSFELLEKSRSPVAIGVATGHPYRFDFLGGPCFSDGE